MVIGASAGGIAALQVLLGGLPADLNAAVLIVVHTSAQSGNVLDRIFQRACKLPVRYPSDGTRIKKGHVYVAPADCHMIVEDGTIRVVKGPRENLHRPAIDPLFRSAAMSYGRRAIGVVLTGLLDDGTAGLMVIEANGGVSVVQEPADALFAAMPASAAAHVHTARILPLDEIADALVDLTSEELPETARSLPGRDSDAAKDVKIAELNMKEIENEERQGSPSVFSCPDCGGVLWELEENGFQRFRCRVGHAFTALQLDFAQRQTIESALWSALRALEESASLYRRMADRAKEAKGRAHENTVRRYLDRVANTEANAHTLRNFLIELHQRVADSEESEVKAT